ncbi:NlpC/P60 family protein [uncultured Sulfitobacter sp.]|uniref:C40 family peptidase n=1 Tax=uncultured Sulfitobacter sp. TaxID=191468 RepID=UPI0030DAA521
MSWSNAYLGIPYADIGRSRAGCDCWGLARLVYGAELAITLPDYADGYVSAEEQAEVAALIGQETTASIWQPVKSPMPFDLLLFRHGRHSSHVGIFVADGLMLHMATDDQSKHEGITSPRWVSRLVGTFRHAQCRLKGAL